MSKPKKHLDGRHTNPSQTETKSSMITCRLIDPDKLKVPDDSLSVVRDSMTVLVKR